MPGQLSPSLGLAERGEHLMNRSGSFQEVKE